MTRRLHSAHLMLLLLISGCVIADPDSQTADTRPPSEMQSIAPAEPARDNDTPLVTNKIPSKDQIQLIQRRMKAAGFDPGPIDGIIGPRTIAALHRFQSGCAMVKDLLDETATDISQESHALKLTALASATPRKDDVRAIQTRMRAAGFNPGPSDGILGAKNKINTGWSSIRLHSDKGFPGNSRSANSNGRETSGSGSDLYKADSAGRIAFPCLLQSVQKQFEYTKRFGEPNSYQR